LIFRSLDQLAAEDGGAGADEGDQVGCVDCSPPGVGGEDGLD
jgi:hypothetical protein